MILELPPPYGEVVVLLASEAPQVFMELPPASGEVVVQVATEVLQVFVELPAPYGGVVVELPGLPGSENAPSGGTDALRYKSARALSGSRVVMLMGGLLTYPDLGVPVDAYRLAGLTPGAVEAGATTALHAAGAVVEEPSWAWTPGQFVYVGPGGVLSGIPPGSGWLRIFAIAQSPTQLLVAPREPIMRTE